MQRQEAARDFAALGTKAGLDMTLPDDPMPEIWAKFVMLAPFHMVSALTRLPLVAPGVIATFPQLATWLPDLLFR